MEVPGRDDVGVGSVGGGEGASQSVVVETGWLWG